MCGICGLISFDEVGAAQQARLPYALTALSKRGPDHQAAFHQQNLSLGHARLSIIDTSAAGHQPLTEPTERYTIVFNGEIYNFKALRENLEKEGVSFRSGSDTEVLLLLYIHYGEACLEKLVGFFAFAVYDRVEGSLFMARDRVGIKPLVCYRDEHVFLFGSEMKALLAFDVPKEIHRPALFAYLQLNYIPGPTSMLKNFWRMMPGTTLTIKGVHTPEPEFIEKTYYTVPYVREGNPTVSSEFYEAAKKNLHRLLDESVQMRLVSDVPLGTFLSGGTDSSVITALASRHVKDLQSFSVGYKDEPFFDETAYARLVAKKLGTDHTVFSLTNEDLFEHLHDVLDYLDEPFADSSALAVYILSKKTREKVTVALSGDGADELFSGYNKHAAEFKTRNPGVAENMVKVATPLFGLVPQSRNSKIGNLGRQLSKFGTGMKLSKRDRYWAWASILSEEDANYLLREDVILKTQRLSDEAHDYKKLKDRYLKFVRKDGNMNDVLYADTHLVLPNDMLTKVDLMSMANSLEVRTPFLDHRLVNFAFSIPPSFKINTSMRKKIVQDTFRELLPEELYNRSKKGFEVPLLSWFNTELKSMITDDLLEDNFIEEQGIFNVSAVRNLKTRLFSSNPGDSAATVWALIVFQHWWKKYLA